MCVYVCRLKRICMYVCNYMLIVHSRLKLRVCNWVCDYVSLGVCLRVCV